MSTPLLGALGLCKRAGVLVCGTPMICAALREGRKKPLLVVMASDASEGTRKRLSDKCAFYETVLVAADVGGETLAAAVGKTGFLAAVAVTDRSLAELVSNKLGGEK